MYIPSIYEVTDLKEIEQFIESNSFATLVSVESGTPLGCHLPLELQLNDGGQRVLRGHMAKANPQWKTFVENPLVLAVFLSPVHHYISSSWYGHPEVPTWNYMSVHITGRARIIDGPDLWASLGQIVDKYESTSDQPVQLDALPEKVKAQVNGTVGFEINIDKTEATFKLSQNRSPEDYSTIIRELRNLQSPIAGLMADEMEKRRKK